MIEDISIGSFKPFSQPQTFRFRPLTVLLGRNSAGKSSVIQMLLALKQTVESRDTGTPLVLNSRCVELGSFHDVVHRHEAGGRIKVELRMPGSQRRRDAPGPNMERFLLTLEFAHDARVKRIWMPTWCLRDADGRSVLEVRRPEPDREAEARSDFVSVGALREADRTDVFGSQHFLVDASLIMRSTVRTPKLFEARIGLYDAIQGANARVQQALESLTYLGPLREPPRRLHIAAGESRQDVGFRGEGAVEVLYGQVSAVSRGPALTSRVTKWMREFELSSDLILEEIGGDTGILVVRLVDPNSRTSVGMPDVGFGTSQLFPLIVQGLHARRGTLMAIEQPEIHLHPSAQATLGDLLIDISQRGVRVLVETHSEHLLLRLRRRVAEGALTPEAVGIYIIETGSAGATARPVELDPVGGLADWPEDFFAQDMDDIQARVIAATKRRMGGKDESFRY